MDLIKKQATMVANFDSTEQLKQWIRIADALNISPNGIPYDTNESIDNKIHKTELSEDSQHHKHSYAAKSCSPSASLNDGLWVQINSKNNCERLLNDYPQFASCFAGIIRTAYLYAPKIVVTVADLFDGVFFVSLGPQAVNGILGKSYKDGAKLVISGWKDTLEESLIAFILNSDQKIKGKTYCTLDSRLLGVPMLERASLGWGTHINSDSRRNQTCEKNQIRNNIQSSRMNYAEGNVTGKLVELLMQALYQERSNELAECGIAGNELIDVSLPKGVLQFSKFLATRWQEWIDAERRGEIIYQKQATVLTEKEFRSVAKTTETIVSNFIDGVGSHTELMKWYGDTTQTVELKTIINGINAADPSERSWMAVKAVLDKPILERTEALELFKGIYSSSQCEEHKRLEGWYEYVYQKALAEHVNGIPDSQSHNSDRYSQQGTDTKRQTAQRLVKFMNSLQRHNVRTKEDKNPCNLIYVSNKKVQNNKEKDVIPSENTANCKLQHKRGLFNLIHRLKHFLHPGNDNEDECDILMNNIYVENCFINELKERKKEAHNIRLHTLSGPVTDALRQMPHSKFEIFCYESRSTIRRWQNKSSKHNTRGIGYCVMQAGTESTFTTKAKSLLSTTIFTAIIAAVSVCGDHFITNNFVPLIVAVTLSWFIAIAPNLIDIYHWLKDVQICDSTVLIDD